jgi:hypothetical protein
MIYDMEESSHYSEPFDYLTILSGKPNEDMIVDGQIINVIAPSGLRGELFHQAGD